MAYSRRMKIILALLAALVLVTSLANAQTFTPCTNPQLQQCVPAPQPPNQQPRWQHPPEYIPDQQQQDRDTMRDLNKELQRQREVLNCQNSCNVIDFACKQRCQK